MSEYNILGEKEEETITAAKIDMLAADIAIWATDKGFWNIPPSLDALCAAEPVVARFMDGMRKAQKGYLMISELGEHCEALRKPTPSALMVQGINNETEELADLIIRALDYCGKYELPIGEAIIRKMAVNQKRPYLHGDKKF